jgi:hypothetical protein
MWVRLLLSSILPSAILAGCADLPGDEPPPGECSSQQLRLTQVHLPHSGSEAAGLGFDLDGDRVIDNQLGSLSAALAAIYPAWDPEAWLADRLTESEVHWLARIDRCDGEASWSARLARAEDADGDGRPEIIEEGAPAEGDGTVATDGIGLVPVGYFADGGGMADDAAWEDAPSLSISTRASSDGNVTLTLGLAVPLGDAALAPAAAFLTAELSRGSRFAQGIDTDDDSIVSVTELRASPAVAVLLAPDIDTDADGTPDAISIGFSATARPVTLD